MGTLWVVPVHINFTQNELYFCMAPILNTGYKREFCARNQVVHTVQMRFLNPSLEKPPLSHVQWASRIPMRKSRVDTYPSRVVHNVP